LIDYQFLPVTSLVQPPSLSFSVSAWSQLPAAFAVDSALSAQLQFKCVWGNWFNNFISSTASHKCCLVSVSAHRQRERTKSQEREERRENSRDVRERVFASVLFYAWTSIKAADCRWAQVVSWHEYPTQ